MACARRSISCCPMRMPPRPGRGGATHFPHRRRTAAPAAARAANLARSLGALLAPDCELVELNASPGGKPPQRKGKLTTRRQVGPATCLRCWRRHSGESYGAVEGYPQARDVREQARDDRQQAQHQLGQAGSIVVLQSFAERQEADDQEVGRAVSAGTPLLAPQFSGRHRRAGAAPAASARTSGRRGTGNRRAQGRSLGGSLVPRSRTTGGLTRISPPLGGSLTHRAVARRQIQRPAHEATFDQAAQNRFQIEFLERGKGAFPLEVSRLLTH
jgi:hypothetical protein